jgi:hypothetical protein
LTKRLHGELTTKRVSTFGKVAPLPWLVGYDYEAA